MSKPTTTLVPTPANNSPPVSTFKPLSMQETLERLRNLPPDTMQKILAEQDAEERAHPQKMAELVEARNRSKP